MEGVTLLESGTSRIHFAFLKRLEATKSAEQADEMILDTIAEVQIALSSKSTQSWSSASLTSQLLLLLHCIELFPSSNNIDIKRSSIQKSLIPALHLAAIASKPKELYIAYSVLKKIFAAQSDEEQRQTSLLLLNTTRQHLEASSSYLGEASDKIRRSGKQRMRNTNPFALARTSIALRSIIAGVPAGPDIFPALYSPISQLCHHPDESTQRLALDALGKIFSYVDSDEGLSRAIWERVRGIIKSYRSKHPSKSKATGDSLPRALLRATKRAVIERVIESEAACEIMLTFINVEDSPTLTIACIESCVEMAVSFTISPSMVERLWELSSVVCLAHPANYSVLLSCAGVLGKLVSIDTPSRTPQMIQPVWILIKSHLTAKNANRKLLLLSALESLIPFRWYDASNDARIELDESEMKSLIALLGDRDESIRFKSLRLFNRIDSSLLDSHLDQLVIAASKMEGQSVGERQEFSLRALEVGSVRYARSEATQYSSLVHKLQAFHSDDKSVNERFIQLILRHLRAADKSYSSQCLETIAKEASLF